jgi:hypothetical protein
VNYFASRVETKIDLQTSPILEKVMELKMIQSAFQLIKVIQGQKGGAKKGALIIQPMRTLNLNLKTLMNFTMRSGQDQMAAHWTELTLWGIMNLVMSDGQPSFNKQLIVCRKTTG